MHSKAIMQPLSGATRVMIRPAGHEDLTPGPQSGGGHAASRPTEAHSPRGSREKQSRLSGYRSPPHALAGGGRIRVVGGGAAPNLARVGRTGGLAR